MTVPITYTDQRRVNDVTEISDLIERGRYEVAEDRRIANLMMQPENREKLLQRAQVTEDLIAKVEELRNIIVDGAVIAYKLEHGLC